MNPKPDSSPPDDDLPPHLASPEAFARWCREHPEEVRQMEVNARRMELGEFGDVTPELQANITKFLAAQRRLREAQAMSDQLLAEIATVRETLSKAEASVPTTHLVEQLAVIEARLKRGEDIGEEWSDFQLQYTAFQGELMGSIRRRTALLAMALDDMERRDPKAFANDQQMQKLLRWWREEGGREDFLSGITLEERRELEAREQEWRKKPSGSKT